MDRIKIVKKCELGHGFSSLSLLCIYSCTGLLCYLQHPCVWVLLSFAFCKAVHLWNTTKVSMV